MTHSTLLPVSLIVIARNEAKVVARCLQSVPFAAEKIVVDAGSTDDTVRIALNCGARVVQQEWLGFGRQRNFASSLAAHDWILVLDADETLSPELSTELSVRLPQLLGSAKAGAVFNRSTCFMGAPMRWYRPMVRERIARLYHRGRARWTEARVHEHLVFDAPIDRFHAAILHANNPTLVHKQLKTLRYTELKARDWSDRGRPPRMWLCPLIFATTFFKDYILRLAFLDGWRGYVVAQIAASYAVYKRLRYFEMRVNPCSGDLARQLLRQHGLEP